MAESESSMSTNEGKTSNSPHGVKKPKKRSIVERELETNMTARMTSPLTGEGMSTSRYGRARRLKTGELEKKPIDTKPIKSETTPNKSPTAYKMHALNSPYKVKTPKKSIESNINNQIDSIYQENISLSRFNDHSPSPAKKSPKVYVRKDLIQTKDDEDDVILIKNLFSPIKHTLSSKKENINSTEKCNGKEINSTANKNRKATDSTENHKIQIKIESAEKLIVKKEFDSTEKYNTNQNGIDNTSVVKTLDFDENNKRKSKDNKPTLSKNELFEIEAKSPYQVGDLAWARMGTFPFWPCMVTRDPYSEMFVKKKLFGRVEHNILHVTFFADNGRRSWIVDNMLRPYAGRDEFESTRDKFTTDDKKKDPRLYAAFFISEKKQTLWNDSVEEAETVMKEPKRFRIDILNDMIHKARASKKQPKSGKVTRTDSDVSLSESLYDSLFSEDDSKTEEGRLRNRSKNPKSFDVSDVVTACLDNMAAKTGNSKIQRQSHMDRWLQKAKSKTPEKNQSMIVVKTENKSGRLRGSKSNKSKKTGTKSHSVSNTDESNISDIDVKSSIGKDSSAEESISVSDSKTFEGLKTPILLADDVEKPCTEESSDVVVKQELIDQENDKNRDIKVEELEINTDLDKTVDKQKITLQSSKNMNVVKENRSESNNHEFDVKAEDTNEIPETANKGVIDTTQVTNNSEAMDVDHNFISESNIVKTGQENVKSNINVDENLSKSNMDLNVTVDDSKYLEAWDNNEINSLAHSFDAVEQPKICEIMEVDDKLPPETKPAEDNTSKVNTDSNKNKAIFLDEASAEAEDNCQINRTPIFLGVDHKHLRDENIDGNSDIKNKTIDLNVEIKAPKNKNEKENLCLIIHKTNISNNQITADKREDDILINEINDVLNESGNSESILQSNALNLDEKDMLNNAEVVVHLRDGNLEIDGNSDIKNKTISLNVETKAPKNKNEKENLSLIIHKTNISNNQLTANKSEDNILINEIDDVLNESGNSESILQSNALEFDEKDMLNNAEVVKKDVEPSVSKVNQDIDHKTKDDTKHLDNNIKSIETEPSSVHNDNTNVEKECITGSSTPKHSDEDILGREEKHAEINSEPGTYEYYEIDDSDDEPSPEYEPLGEDITEDFRKHMQTIEQCLTDKKDEAQIVKICDLITKTVKQEILDSISPTKTQVEHAKAIEKSPITQVKPISPQEKYADKISSKNQLINHISPITPEKQKLKIHNVSKTSLPDKSIEDLINELSPEENPVTKRNAEYLKLNVTPRKTRSKCKIFNDNYSQNSELEKNDKASTKETKIFVNGAIEHTNSVLDKFDENEHELLVNGSIKEIYSKMRANEPKVVLTPLKNVNKKAPKTDRNKRSENKFKLSLRKNRLYEIDSSDLDSSVDEPTVKTEYDIKSKVVPIENGIEATIPISKQNGHSSKNTSKLAEDDDFDVDAASISSDDSRVSSVNTSIPTPRRSSRCKTKFANGSGYAEFLHYFELRQDYLLDEYPGLEEDEIETYLQKTWEYEESLKCDVKKSDDIRHSNLVKGLKQEMPKKESNNKKSKTTKSKNCIENYFTEKKVEIKLEPIIKSEETAEINHITDIQSCVSKPTSNIDTSLNETIADITTTPKIHKEIEDITPVKPTLTIDLTEDEEVSLVLADKVKEEIDATPISNYVSTPKSSKKKRHSNSDTSKSIQSIIENKNISVKSEDIDTESIDSDSEIPLRQLRSKVLKEKFNVTKISSPVAVKLESDVLSVQSDDEPLNKHIKKKNVKKTENSYENPEFVKFLELRQDALIDENPQLTREEIVDYLYKTWLYEESSKSDIKKNDEIEQSNLVKGLKQETPPKKAKRKQKLDKTTDRVDEEVKTNREKPKRKTAQPLYNEELYSDIEEEIELFEIFRKKSSTTKKETKQSETVVKGEKSDEVIEIEYETDKITVKDEVTNDLVKQEDAVLIEEEPVLDSWETYFADLLKPKPNVFKGLVREKVCEICEKTSNLYKCKGCNGMFHQNCLKVEDVIEINTPNRGRKKKKKPGRRNKNLEDSESQSDEKSQDISGEQNVSLEEIMIDTCTFDAETLEAKISEKMQEMLNSEDVNYDSYSSDDGIDWTGTVAGKCEIVDVKLKPKTPIVDYTNFKCNNCQQFDTPVCFVCKLAVSKKDVKMRQKCHIAQCHKYYHLECLDHWPQTQFLSGEPSRNNKKINEFFEALSCPRHVCHTCVSDDPRGCRTRFSGDKLARCVRCPATYHSFTKCLPAGSQILTASQIICPRHYQQVASRPGKAPCHVNTGWCFICALGGSLICCEYCPTSFHAECLNIKPPEGNYMCEDCETGRLPLYGEMVWVKLGHYRWWPGIILHPSEISDNLMSVKHSLGEFVVRFFGQYDHYWVNRGRVFPYQEGDSGRISNQKTKIDAAFTTAMEHAQRAFEILKNANPNEEESLDIASSLLPPHYVKLKCNKPCGSLISRREDPALSLTQCECDPEESDPCGPYSHCLNRMLLTECGPTCRAGDRCNNRAFEKRLYPKMAPYRTPQRGWGLKTLDDIKAGQFVIEYVGELIDEEEFRRRMRRKHEIRDENFYFLTLDKERMIDAGPKGNLARFMNHCCEPNCETQKWTVLGDVRVGLFALYDIPANSEVTFNYNLECAGIDKKRCMCGAKRCAGYIGAKPKQDENQSRKGKAKLSNNSNKDGVSIAKRTYNKKRKTDETTKTKQKKLGRPPKPKELTDIEKDLLIIKNATNDNIISSTTNSSSSKNDASSSNNSTDELNSTANSESSKKCTIDNISSSENFTNNLISSKNTTKDVVNNKNTNNNITSSKTSIKNTKTVSSSEKVTENVTSSKNATNDNVTSSKNSARDILNSEKATVTNCRNTTSSINITQNISTSENTTNGSSSKNNTNENVTSSKNNTKSSENEMKSSENEMKSSENEMKSSENDTKSSENTTNSSEKSRTQSLDEKPKALKRKLVSNSIEESSISSSSAPKRQKCIEVGD